MVPVFAADSKKLPLDALGVGYSICYQYYSFEAGVVFDSRNPRTTRGAVAVASNSSVVLACTADGDGIGEDFPYTEQSDLAVDMLVGVVVVLAKGSRASPWPHLGLPSSSYEKDELCLTPAFGPTR